MTTRDTSPALRRSLFETAALTLIASLVYVSCQPDRLDENLCPAGKQPLRTTVLLLDTSDPLTPKLREELERLVGELTGDRGSARPGFLVAPGEALIVYELPRTVSRLEPAIRVCNPGGDPSDWNTMDNLTQGKMIALRRWQRFLDAVEPLFNRTEASPHIQSPIIEALGIIVPRHVMSQRTLTAAAKPLHLILFSDLLQHSDDLSHYGTYPSPEEVKAKLRHLQTDLSGVEVSLYRLERGGDSHWQTTDHYYWWTKLIQAFNGRVIFQRSV